MARVPPVSPVRAPAPHPSEGWVETHPSYGMIGFHRVHGHSRLFGSRVPSHHDFVILRVHTGSRRFSYGQEKVSSEKRVVEVALSAVQFARLLTEMNMGDGVPCTLRYVNGQEMPEVPDLPPELHEATEQAREAVIGVQDRVERNIASVREKLAGKVSKAVLAEVENVFGAFLTDVRSNIPFWSKQVDAAAERASAAAQAEVDAYITGAVHRAGLAALQDPEVARRLLTRKEE